MVWAFQIVAIASRTVTTDEDGIPNTVLIDHTFSVPSPEDVQINERIPAEPTDIGEAIYEKDSVERKIHSSELETNNRAGKGKKD